MKNSIRCCISCILPCGALDVIRIVHANGRVEEISGTVKAAEIMKAHPKHVLKKPSSPSEQGMSTMMCPKIVVVPPDAQLQRGKIYFLMPMPSPPPDHQKPRSTRSSSSSSSTTTTTTTSYRKKKKKREGADHHHHHQRGTGCNSISTSNFLVSDRYLAEILSEKVSSSQRDRRRGRTGVWRPHLESISETPTEAYS